MTGYLDEVQVEIVAVGYLLRVRPRPRLAPDGAAPERADYGQVVLVDRFRHALERINPEVPPEAIEDALRKVTRPKSRSLIITLNPSQLL